MKIDHVIYAAPDLDAAVDDLEIRLGVRAAGGGQHSGQGTHNKLLALGPGSYLELIAPDPGQPEPAGPRPYGVDGVTSGRLVGWALACHDIERARAAARTEGFDPGDIMEGQRLTPAGNRLRWRITRNALAAGLVPFLIDWGHTPHPSSTVPTGAALRSLHIEHPDPAAVTGALRALGAQIDVRPAHRPALVARIDGPRGTVELR